MIKHIGIFLGNNLYDTKRHFSTKLAEAFARHGIRATLFDCMRENPIKLFRSMRKTERPDFCCSFYVFIAGQTYLWNDFSREFDIPFWQIWLDPPHKQAHVMSKDLIVSCVDYFDLEYVQRLGYKKSFFWGHGVEQELAPAESQDKPFDVVFMGTSYDPDGLEKAWSKASQLEQKAIREAIELYFSHRDLPYDQVAEKIIGGQEINRDNLFYFLSSYTKGYDRLALIRAIKNVTVHVFGGACFRPPNLVKGWQAYFANSPNVLTHPAIPIKEALEVLKKSKICLNSSPFFKNGTHERLFLGAACNCLMLTTDTLWIQNHFKIGQELLVYEPLKWADVNEKINYYLAHESERKEMAQKGRNKVMQNHTWDHRVREFLEQLSKLDLYER
jgi:spore maturation protein CgeB